MKTLWFRKYGTSISIALLVATLLATLPARTSFSGNIENLPYYPGAPYPCSYVINTNGTWVFRWNATTGLLEQNSTNKALPIQNGIDILTVGSGGLIFVCSGNYGTASVTVKSNVVLMLESGVAGLSYTTSGTGIVLRYANGYAILDAPLNMTGHQIVSGVFHSGSTPPTSPIEGQPFYDTDDHTLYVWNSTAWVSSLGSGSTHDTHQDYSYLVFVEGSTYSAKNGTTEQIDYESTNCSAVIQYVINHSPRNNKHLRFGYGLFECNYNVTYPVSCCMLWEGVGARYSGYSGLETIIYGTLIYFDKCSLIQVNDAGQGAWYNENWATFGWTYFVIDHMAIAFEGDGTNGKNGVWGGCTTLPIFTEVALIVRGSYPTGTEVLFSRGTGATGSCVWQSVTLDVCIASSNVQAIRMNQENFVWIGGAININQANTTSGTIIFRLEVTRGSNIEEVSLYRDTPEASGTITWFHLTATEGGAYQFKGLRFYDLDDLSSVTYHFSETGTADVYIDLQDVYGCDYFKVNNDIFVLKSTSYFTSVANGSYVDIRERQIPLGGTPQIVVVSAQNALAWYGVVNATHVQIYGNNATLTGSVYCEYKP